LELANGVAALGMILSLNEVEATGRKAARGAGQSWGLAEEAGRAARWLAEWGLPGPSALARVLTALDGAERADHAPQFSRGVWMADPGPLSPLAVGAALWDRAGCGLSQPVYLGPCLWPILLLPYAAWIARARGCAISVSWLGMDAVAGRGGGLLACHGDPLIPVTERLTLGDTDDHGGARPVATEVAVPPEDLDRLERLAHRTYAPATEESRLSGAGSGLTDND
jgi:hypothetical protein